ncbi:MAG: hypothetical protein IPL46_20520 [Saprospiraceae bacterium]|nr:hypothetical protein [Saprospiraceae bacterium]
MKTIIHKNVILVVTIFSLITVTLMADSSKVSNSIFTVEEMHLQEVILQVRMDSLRTSGKLYIIRKSEDGIHYSTLTEMGDPAREVRTLVFADHVPVKVLTHYQLIAHDNGSEEVVATIVFDPEAPVIDQSLNISVKEGEPGNSRTMLIDPHAI